VLLLLADFKIVYIAPMKALAAEMVANFSKRLQYLNIVVRELVRRLFRFCGCSSRLSFLSVLRLCL